MLGPLNMNTLTTATVCKAKLLLVFSEIKGDCDLSVGKFPDGYIQTQTNKNTFFHALLLLFLLFPVSREQFIVLTQTQGHDRVEQSVAGVWCHQGSCI